MVVATDHNAGSSPTLSPLRMLNMACTLFRLTPEEALTPPWRLAPERWAELQMLLGAPPSVAPDWKPA